MDFATGTATGDASVGTDAFSGVNLVSGSRFDDTFIATGARGDLFFLGNAGNDVIIGSAEGINNFDSNSAVYGSSKAGISVRLGAHSRVTGDALTGTDTLSNVETIIGSFYDDLFVADSAFFGAFGRYNMFQGRQGDDTIRGNGFTTISFFDDDAAVKVDLAKGIAFAIDPGHAEAVGVDTILGGVNGVFGSRHDDIIIGSDGPRAEILRGGEGNDLIDGGGGTMNVIEYRNRFTDVIVDLAAGTASDGYGDTDTLLNIQGVRGSEGRDIISGDGTANQLVGEDGDDDLFGGGGNDILVGDDNFDPWAGAFGTYTQFDTGADLLDGGVGDDRMIGGRGNDIYVVDSAGDSVEEDANGGVALVRTSLDGYRLAADVENLAIDGKTGTTAIGNSLDNRMSGNRGFDRLIGGSGRDQLNGGGGDDVLQGGNERDVATGGLGADTFVFSDGDFGGAVSATADRISDFSRAQGDQIDLRPTDANTLVAGDQAFDFVGTAAFGHVAGQLCYQVFSGRTEITGDIDGDGTADFMIRVDGSLALGARDFQL